MRYQDLVIKDGKLVGKFGRLEYDGGRRTFFHGVIK